jgi:hypothetical protein
VAIYADEVWPPTTPVRDTSRAFLDYKEQAPSRFDGFMVPVADRDVADNRAAVLLSLADRASSNEAGVLLRHFLGSFACCKCGAQGPIRSGP